MRLFFRYGGALGRRVYWILGLVYVECRVYGLEGCRKCRKFRVVGAFNNTGPCTGNMGNM